MPRFGSNPGNEGMDAYDWPSGYYDLYRKDDMQTTLTKLPTDCPIGFTFQYRGRRVELEGWVGGVPLFSDSGVVREAYSAAIEAACCEAWEARVK